MLIHPIDLLKDHTLNMQALIARNLDRDDARERYAFLVLIDTIDDNPNSLPKTDYFRTEQEARSHAITVLGMS